MKIFISYSHKDSGVANSLKEKLSNRGFETLEIEHDPIIGDNIAVNIDRAVHEADAFIILLSKSYQNSKWSGVELMMIYDQTFGRKNGKRILPILLDENAKIPALLKDVAYMNLSDKRNMDLNLNRITHDLSENFAINDAYEYKRIKNLLKEREELLKMQKMDYQLNYKKRLKLKKSFQLSFLIVTLVSIIVTVAIFFDKSESFKELNASINIQHVVFYLLGFLTAIIPSLYIVIKRKQEKNGK